MTPEGELRVQVAQTAAFVNTRPVTVVLTPHSLAGDGSGGKKKTALPPRTPQRMRFVEQGEGTASTDLGTQYTQRATLLGVPTVAIAVDDEFSWDGSTWRVDEIQFPNDWSVRATVLRFGPRAQ